MGRGGEVTITGILDLTTFKKLSNLLLVIEWVEISGVAFSKFLFPTLKTFLIFTTNQ